MGASNSKPEEDKSVQLCRARKKYVKKALNGRCLLADTHIAYIQSLRSTGRALREFCELEGLINSSLSTSNDVPPKTVVPDEKHSSDLSFSSISISRLHSPFNWSFQASRNVSEKERKVTTLNTPHKAIHDHKTRNASVSSPSPAETSPWDYFNLSHTVFDQHSAEAGSDLNKGHRARDDTRSLNAEDERKANEPNDSITESEYDDETNFVHEREDSDEFYKDFDDILSEGFVRSFESTNLASDVGAATPSSIGSASTEISETMPKERSRSPGLSPLGTIASSVPAHVNLKKMVDMDGADIKENLSMSMGSKISPKDLCSSMTDIGQLFVRASECGQEIPRMLEAYKLHFRPELSKRKGESTLSRCLNAIFSCKELSQIPEDPAQVNTRYLTWQRTMSARFVSSMNAAGQNARDDVLASSISDIHCMRSGSHASTLDRLYAWEKKLYDEVKVSQVVRNAYDMKCKLLRDQESRGEPVHRVDKTRVVIKDLHSRIRVAIKRMDSISKKIEEIRDNELQPQLEELAKGLSNMWERMHDCHKLQYRIISIALGNGTKIAINSEAHQQLPNHLEQQLSLMSSSFTKWIAAHESYLQAIDGWLLKCVVFPEKSSRKKRRHQPVSIRRYGPPIFTTCGEWLEGLEKLPTKDLADSIKCLAAETSRLLPRQEKHHGDNNLVNTFNQVGNSFNAWRSDFDNFRSSLMQFFSQLNIFSDSSANMYRELGISIQKAKNNYEQLLKTSTWKSSTAVHSSA